MLPPTVTFDDFTRMKPLSPKARASIRADGWMTVWEGAIRSGKTVASIIAWLMYLRNTREKVFFMSGKTYGSLIRNVVEGDYGIISLGAPDVQITKDRTGSNVLVVGDKKVYLFGRTVKKHCNRAMLEAVKLFPEFRGFERGRLAFTFVTSMMCNDCHEIVAFTAKPKQIGCVSYTVKLVDMHLRSRFW